MKEKMDVKIGTKDQVVWETVLKNHETAVTAMEKDLIVYKEIIKLAKEKIAQEKEKLK